MSPLSNQEATEKLRAGMRFQWPQNTEPVNTQNRIETMCNADVMSVLKARKWCGDLVNCRVFVLEEHRIGRHYT